MTLLSSLNVSKYYRTGNIAGLVSIFFSTINSIQVYHAAYEVFQIKNGTQSSSHLLNAFHLFFIHMISHTTEISWKSF